MSGEAGEWVQAWLVSGDGLSRATVAELFDVLDEEERRRADCLTLAEGRRRFIVAHGAMRIIVARRLGAPPRDLAWKTGRHGKPELTGQWTGVHVNLSHSGGLCLVALSGSRPVGADVQQISPRLDVIAMAGRYFSPQEARIVADGRDSEDRAQRFAELWSRKEAAVKADGGRLTQVLPCSVVGDGEAVVEIPVSARCGAVDFPEDALSPSAPRDAEATGEVALRYRVKDIPAPPGYRAAVALSGVGRFTVETQTWKP